MTAYHSDIYAKAERMNTQCGALGQSQLGTAALLKAVRWDFRLADGLVVFFVSFITLSDFLFRPAD